LLKINLSQYLFNDSINVSFTTRKNNNGQEFTV
jgi:hypothetical protein